MEENNKSFGGTKLIKLFLGFSMASWISALISFVVTPIITRVIEPEALGSIDLFVSFCVMFEYASTLGVHQALMRFYNEPPQGSDGDELLRFAVRVSSLGAAVAGVAIFIFSGYFSRSIIGRDSLAVPLLMFVFILSNGFIDVLKTRPRMLGQTLRYTAMVVCLSVGTKLAYLSFGATRSVLSTVSAIALVDSSVMVLFFIVERKSLIGRTARLTRSSKLEVMRYALPTIPVMFMSNVNTSIPKIVLNQFVDSYSVGVYAATTTLVNLISLIQTGVNLFWSPFVFSNYHERQSEIQKVHLVVTLCMTVGGLMLILFQDVLFLLLGDAYRRGSAILGLLAASPIFYTIGETLGIGINIAKKTYWNILVVGMALVCNLAACWLLVPVIGLRGAAYGVMLSAALMLVIKAWIGERYYKVITSPAKTAFAPAAYASAAIFSSVYAESTVLRTILTLALLTTLCLAYASEVREMLGFARKQLNRLLCKTAQS